MKSLFVFLTSAVFIMAGCYPQAVIIWSPDGQHGAVLAQDNVYFCDPQGKLSPRSLTYSGPAAWSPTANDFYYVSQLQISSWNEAVKYLDKAKQAEIISQATDALARLKPGGLKDEKKNPFSKFEADDLILSLLYLKDNCREELRKKAVASKDDEKSFRDIEKLKAPLYQLFVCRNCDWNKPELIVQTFMDMNWLRVSPNNKAVAFVKSEKTLYVCDMKGRISLVAKNTAVLPDWTPDGNTLTYSSAATDKEASNNLRLGSIKQAQIFNERGEMLEKFSQPTELAGVLFHETCKIRCLKNGWIIFSSAAMKLPATAKEMPQEQSVFAIIPELKSKVINIIPQETRQYMGPTEWDTFQLSPDQKRLAVLGSDKNVLWILNISDSRVQKITLGLRDDMKPFLPTWQNNKTLCLLSGTYDTSGKNGIAVILSADGKDQVISRNWSAALMDSLNEKYKENKTQSTKPAKAKPAKPADR